MPEKEPNKHPRSTEMRQVMILPLSTNSIWLRAEDIPWMIQYMADEVGPSGSQCVPAIGLDDDETDAPNADGVLIEWDFEDCWRATCTMGPLAGQVFRCKVATLTKDKWDKVAETRSYTVSYEAADEEQRKQAAFDFLEDYCHQRMREMNATPEAASSGPETTSATPEDAN